MADARTSERGGRLRENGGLRGASSRAGREWLGLTPGRARGAVEQLAVQPELAHAAALARRRGGPAHLHVRLRGETVLDQRLGVGPDAAFWPFSVSKIHLATLIWALAEDGVLELDAPIAEYWPEFAAAGKAAITIRDVLRHRSGLPRIGTELHEVAVMTRWELATSRIAAARPIRTPADEPAYEWLAWGFILGEVAQRAANRPLPQLLRDRILARLGAEATFLGLPDAERWRSVPFRGTDLGSQLTAAVLNRAAVRRAVIPAGGVMTTARELADLLEELRQGGGRLGFAPGRIDELTAPSNDGRFDRFAGSRTWWSDGLQLGAPGRTAFGASAFGRRSSPRAFGHNGSNASIAWTDPDRELTFVYLGGVLEPFPVNRFRLMGIEDAVLEAVDRAATRR